MQINKHDAHFRDQHFSPADFAHELGVPLATAYRYVGLRKVSSIRIGKRVWIPRSELTRLVTEGTRHAV